MPDNAYCSSCRTVAPVVRSIAGKAIGAAVGSIAGGASTKSLGGAMLAGALTFGLGHLVDEAIGAACGRCGAPIRVTAGSET